MLAHARHRAPSPSPTVRSAAWASGPCSCPGPACSGHPRTVATALAILRRAVDAGVNHIDTAQFYGPDVANDLIYEALHPYPEDLVLVSKVGARRDGDRASGSARSDPRSCGPASRPTWPRCGLDQVPVVNLRRHPGVRRALRRAAGGHGRHARRGPDRRGRAEQRHPRRVPAGHAGDDDRLRPERLQRGRPLGPGRVRRLRGRRRALRAVLPARLRLHAGASPC